MNSDEIYNRLIMGNYKNDIVNIIKYTNVHIRNFDPVAMLNMGHIYWYHYEDIEKGIYWYTQSAELDNLRAIHRLAFIYNVVKKDTEKTIYWYTKAIELFECTTSMINLANLMYRKKDYDRAIDLYSKVLKKENNIDCIYSLGEIYLVKEDTDKAVEFFKKASELGCKKSKAKLESIKVINKVYNDITKDDCCICYDNLNKKINVVLLCGHVYHLKCAKQLKKCPLCKTDVEFDN